MRAVLHTTDGPWDLEVKGMKLRPYAGLNDALLTLERATHDVTGRILGVQLLMKDGSRVFTRATGEAGPWGSSVTVYQLLDFAL